MCRSVHAASAQDTDPFITDPFIADPVDVPWLTDWYSQPIQAIALSPNAAAPTPADYGIDLATALAAPDSNSGDTKTMSHAVAPR